MTFDELCKAVKKANKDAEVIQNIASTEVAVSGNAVVLIPELSTKKVSSSRFSVIAKEYRIKGFGEIVSAAAEYNNTEHKLRGLEPLWYVTTRRTEWKGGANPLYSPYEQIVLSDYLIIEQGPGHTRFPKWYWGTWEEASPLSKKQIEKYLTTVYGEEKAGDLIDAFIEALGERVR